MATYYVDLYNGDDGNDGSTWALAKKTIAGINQASLNPGDTVKIIKTPTPTLIGNASWVQNTETIITETALTKSVETCVGNTWTAVTGVTLSTSNYRKYGANAQQFSVTAAASGKLAYKSLTSTLDLSAYTKLSFLTALTSGTVLNYTNSDFYIALCSDSTGDTIVDTFPIGSVNIANFIHTKVIDKGSALGSAINSIALYRSNTASATVNIMLNNIFAANGLHHDTIIGRSQSPFTRRYAVMSIIDDTITVDNNVHSNGFSVGYVESTESLIPLYGLEGVRLTGASATTAVLTFSKDGTSELPITWSFGWDKDTDLQDGETWFDGQAGLGRFIYITGQHNIIEKICGSRYYSFHRCIASNYYQVIKDSISICSYIGLDGAVNVYLDNIMFLNITRYAIYSNTSNSVFKNILIENFGQKVSSQIGYAIYTDTGDSGGHYFENITLNFKPLIDYSSSYYITSSGNTFKNFTNLGIQSTTIIGGANKFINFVSNSGVTVLGRECEFTNCKFNNGFVANSANVYNHNQVEGVHFYQSGNPYCAMQYLNDVAFNTVLGIWEIVLGRPLFTIAIENYIGITQKKRENIFFRIAEVAVEAGVQTSISLWVKRTNTTGRPIGSESANGTKGSALILRAENSPAIDADVMYEFPDGLFNWTLFGLVFTPERTGIVTLEIWAYYNDKQFIQFSTLNVAT